MRFANRAVLLALPVVAFGLAAAAPASAQQDSVTQELEDIRTAVGLGRSVPPMDFAERPPLVVPPSYTLPPPGPGEDTRLGVNDPDVFNRRKALVDARRPVPADDPGAGAAGRMSRTYLIDPPSGLRDPDAVLSGGGPATRAPDTARSKHARVHKKKKVAAAAAD